MFGFEERMRITHGYGIRESGGLSALLPSSDGGYPFRWITFGIQCKVPKDTLSKESLLYIDAICPK